ncbi:hypothetical protein L6452_36894 [Arctium lappa]|uniref:Uncharacterized protein n=1 Tax=Arctium lappa TaxID=4217 RepID=A0ACB8Y0Q9_ARCLA|nr:hypothetical protein L6452_36894 [Arctium lappa]
MILGARCSVADLNGCLFTARKQELLLSRSFRRAGTYSASTSVSVPGLLCGRSSVVLFSPRKHVIVCCCLFIVVALYS